MSAYSILIADDNPLIVSALETIIKALPFNLRIIESCNRGDLAWEIIKSQRPDILLLDISMPGHTGIEVAEKVQQKFNQIFIIIITAHGTFEYARSALRFGVQEFLLKPIDPLEVEKTLKKGMVWIDEKRTLQKANNLRELAHLNLLQEQHDTNLLVQQQKDLITSLGIQFFPSDYQQDLWKFTGKEKRLALYRDCINTSQDLETNGVRKDNHNYLITVLQKHVNNIPTKNKVWMFSHPLGTGLISLASGFSQLIPVVEGWAIGGSDLFTNSFPEEKHFSQAYFRAGIAFFSEKLTVFSDHEVDTNIKVIDKEMSQMVKKAKWDPLSFKLLLKEKILEEVKILERNPAISQIDSIMIAEILERISTSGSLRDLAKHVSSFREIIDSMPTKVLIHGNPGLISVVRFVENNYHKQISIEDCASEIGKSSRQITRYLHEAFQLGFSTYLTQVRVRRVLFLLRTTNHPIAEIAEACGFSSYTYFFQVFKKLTGKSPKYFRMSESLIKYPNIDMIPLRK